MIGEREFRSMLVDGRHLSGIRLAPKTKWPGRDLTRVDFENCDFEAVVMGGLLSRPSFQGCAMRGVNLSGINAQKATWKDCVFVDLQMDGAFGVVRNSVFRGCNLTQVRLGGMLFEACVFDACQFNGIVAAKVNFKSVRFQDCVFSGTFSSVNWVDCTTQAVDVSGVQMLNCSLIDHRVPDIKFPDNDENFFATLRDFTAAVEPMRGKLSSAAFQSFVDASEFLRVSAHGEILDVEFFEGLSKAEVRVLMSEFRALLRATSSSVA